MLQCAEEVGARVLHPRLCVTRVDVAASQGVLGPAGNHQELGEAGAFSRSVALLTPRHQTPSSKSEREDIPVALEQADWVLVLLTKKPGAPAWTSWLHTLGGRSIRSGEATEAEKSSRWATGAEARAPGVSITLAPPS